MGGFKGCETGLEVADVALFTFTESALGGTVLFLPPSLPRREIFFYIFATSSGGVELYWIEEIAGGREAASLGNGSWDRANALLNRRDQVGEIITVVCGQWGVGDGREGIVVALLRPYSVQFAFGKGVGELENGEGKRGGIPSHRNPP